MRVTWHYMWIFGVHFSCMFSKCLISGTIMCSWCVIFDVRGGPRHNSLAGLMGICMVNQPSRPPSRQPSRQTYLAPDIPRASLCARSPSRRPLRPPPRPPSREPSRKQYTIRIHKYHKLFTLCFTIVFAARYSCTDMQCCFTMSCGVSTHIFFVAAFECARCSAVFVVMSQRLTKR